MPATPSVGAKSQISLASKQIDFLDLDPGDSAYHLVDASQGRMWGSRFPKAANVVPGLQVFKFSILTQPTAEEMAIMLPLLGVPLSSGTTYTITEDVSTFVAVIDRVAKVHSYATTMVDKWILKGQKGLPWSLELQCIALAESEGTAGSFADTAPSTATGPFAFSMGTLTLNGTAYGFDHFALAGDNKVLARYQNAQQADALVATASEIVLAVSTPYTSDETSLYTTGATDARADGFGGSLAFAFGNVSSSWAFGSLKAPNQPPPIRSKFEEIRLPRYFNVYQDGATKQLVVTHDSNPAI